MTDPAKRAAEIMAKSAANLKHALPNAVKDGAQEAKKVLENELDKVTSGRRLRNVGKSGKKLSVGYDLNLGGDSPSATMKAKGPWPIIERDIGGHAIGPKGKKKKRAIKFGSQGIYAHVSHPGTKGKHPFEKGHKAAAPKVHKAISARVIKDVTSGW